MWKLVTVTGGAGRLGNALVRALIPRTERVRVLEIDPSPRSLAGLDVELVEGSVLDAAAVDAAIGDADVVFHCAAKVDLGPDRDGSVHAINVDGARVVADACLARAKRLVHSSSHQALDRRPLSAPLTEDKPLALEDACPYHRSKARGEELVLERVSRGLDAVIVSPGTLTGPWDFEPSILGRALLDLRAGRLKIVLNAETDYVDVRDVAEATCVAAERGRRGERYLLTGPVRGILEVCRTLEAVTDQPIPQRALPLWVGWAGLPITLALARLRGTPPLYGANMLRASRSNPHVSWDKAARELGFSPRPLEESLRDAFAFYERTPRLSERSRRDA